MANQIQSDNSNYALKVELRLRALAELGSVTPVILETHAGAGKIFGRCYSFVQDGIAFETDVDKVSMVARQRPTWAVYQADCESALAAGAGDHLTVNYVDLDPYGQPWPAIDGFWQSQRPRASRVVMVVNDGLRQKVRINGGWDVESLEHKVEKYGNRLYAIYLQVAEELMREKAAAVGYKLTRWRGYYTGAMGGDMTHYAAVFER
jgi:hypothetical protein